MEIASNHQRQKSIDKSQPSGTTHNVTGQTAAYVLTKRLNTLIKFRPCLFLNVFALDGRMFFFQTLQTFVIGMRYLQCA